MAKQNARIIWSLVAGLIPIILSWFMFTGSGFIVIVLLLGTLAYIILFFRKRPCNEPVPAVGYAASFLLIWAVGPEYLSQTAPPLIFDPTYIGRAIVSELSAALYYVVILYLYIPASFLKCLLTGLVLLIARARKCKRPAKQAKEHL